MTEVWTAAHAWFEHIDAYAWTALFLLLCGGVLLARWANGDCDPDYDEEDEFP